MEENTTFLHCLVKSRAEISLHPPLHIKNPNLTADSHISHFAKTKRTLSVQRRCQSNIFVGYLAQRMLIG